MKLTLFDLDHTLIPFDSDHAWGDRLIELGWVDPAQHKARNDAFYEDYKAGRLDLHAYVAFATRPWVERGATEALAAQSAWVREFVQPRVRPSALALVEAHRAAGDTLAIVTATNEFVTRPIAEAFGIETLIAVDLERDADGWYRNAIRGVPSYQGGKVRRVADWLASRGLDWPDVETTFYSDSMNDLALLEQVDHPVAANPDPRLAGLAAARGWRTLELFPANP